MAFILLLLLSLTTLLQVESSSASISKSNLLARQNALLGFYQALGTLQQTTGPDQRITTTAGIQDTDILTEAIDGAQPGQLYWTGVWDTTDPSAPPRWLVSGDPDTLTIDPATAAADPETLLGLGEVGGLPENTVIAPRVDIDGGGTTTGAFAWWIGDEGVKARYNLPRTPSAALSKQELHWRSSLPTSHGIPYLDPDAAAGVRSFFEPENPKLARASSLDTAALSQTTTTAQAALAVLRAWTHAISFHSSSVLADTVDGGLRKDLSRGLYDQSSELTGFLFPESEAIDDLKFTATSPSIVPTWELLQSYAQYIAGDGTFNSMPSITPRLHSNPQFPHLPGVSQQGVAPIIERATLSLYAKWELASGIWGAAGSTYQLALAVEPVFILHNPYNVRLASADYRLSIKALAKGVSFFIDPASERFFDRGFLRFNIPGTTKWKQDFSFLAPGISFEPGQFKVLSLPAVDVTLPYPIYDAAPELAAGDAFGRMRLELRPSDNVPFTFEELDGATLNFRPARATTSGGNAHGATLKFASAADVFQDSENHLPLHRINRVGGGWFSDKALPDLVGQITGAPPGPQDFEFVYATDIYPANDFPSPTTTSFYYHRDIFRHTNPRFHFSPNAADFSSDSFSGRTEATYQNAFHTAELDKNEPALDTFSDQGYGGPSTILASGAVPQAIEYSIPVQPLQSIAELQHVDLFMRNARVGTTQVGNIQPRYGIGHSFHDHVATNVSRSNLALDLNKINDFSSAPTDLTNIEADFIYQANQALWDDYFFSTLRSQQMATVSADSTLNDLLNRRLQNQRLRPATADALSTSLFDDEIMDMDLAARHLLMEGSFNINSTSVAAWRAFLSSLLEQDSLIAETNPDTFENDTVFFSRTTLPNDEPVASTDSSQNPDYWNGSVSLSEAQIEDLAQAIVQGIKQHYATFNRPFFSIAEFVNRQPNQQTGLLERAIAEAGINDNFIAAYRREAGGDVASTQYAPGFVSQADLLQPLGPFLAARSDTFRLRANGYSQDPVTGQKNLAVCEAIVQRSPQATSGNNRPYEIVDFRWLEPELN